MSSCTSLSEAASIFFQYSTLLIEGNDWTLVEHDGVASIRYTLPAEEQERAYGAELCFSLLAGVLRPFLGHRRPRGVVTFEHARRSERLGSGATNSVPRWARARER